MKKFWTFAIVALLTCFSGLGAQLTVIHGIPGDSIGADRALPVDIYLNESYEAPALSASFPDVAENVEIPGGTYLVEIFLSGSDPETEDPVLSAEATLADDGNYSAVAHLTYTGDAPGIALSLFENNTSPVSPFESRVTARHLANAPQVTLEIRRFFFWPFVKFPGFSNQDGVGPDEVSLDFLTGKIDVNLLVEESSVFTANGISLMRGKHYAVYAIGDFFTDSFQLYLQEIVE